MTILEWDVLSAGNTLDLKHLVPPNLKYPATCPISYLLGKGLSSCLTETQFLPGNRVGGLLEGVSHGTQHPVGASETLQARAVREWECQGSGLEVWNPACFSLGCSQTVNLGQILPFHGPDVHALL